MSWVFLIWIVNARSVSPSSIAVTTLRLKRLLFLTGVVNGLQFALSIILDVFLHRALYLVEPLDLGMVHGRRLRERSLSRATEHTRIALVFLLPGHFYCGVEIVFLNRVEIAFYCRLLQRAVLRFLQEVYWVEEMVAWWQLVADVQVRGALQIVDHYRRIIWHLVNLQLVHDFLRVRLSRRPILLLWHE